LLNRRLLAPAAPEELHKGGNHLRLLFGQVMYINVFHVSSCSAINTA
jgi:hypothetical protein